MDKLRQMMLTGYLNALYLEPQRDPASDATSLPLALIPEIEVQSPPGCQSRPSVPKDGALASATFVGETRSGLFPVGRVAVGVNAGINLKNLYPESSDELVLLLTRHVTGDWGKAGRCVDIQMTNDEWSGNTDETGKLNKLALREKSGQIKSIFPTASGERVWVITHLDGEPYTIVVVPWEY